MVIPTTSPHTDKPFTTIDHIALKPHPITAYPSINKLNMSTSTSPVDNHSLDVIGSLDIVAPATLRATASQPHMLPSAFTAAIAQSSNKLIFLQYTPAGRMLWRWYLV